MFHLTKVKPQNFWSSTSKNWNQKSYSECWRGLLNLKSSVWGHINMTAHTISRNPLLKLYRFYTNIYGYVSVLNMSHWPWSSPYSRGEHTLFVIVSLVVFANKRQTKENTCFSLLVVQMYKGQNWRNSEIQLEWSTSPAYIWLGHCKNKVDNTDIL